ncbi:hypothetical protein [Streptomyces sp. IBSBF 2806]|uniref:hypothetical protein n=1 Tax=Streptomyces sp. IBSBF 2806 TaxID=2903529 RepID=UPI002FDC4DD3
MLVHVNTLLLQQVLAAPAWAKKLSDEDRRGLTALFWSNINPYLDEFRARVRLNFKCTLIRLAPTSAAARSPRSSTRPADRDPAGPLSPAERGRAALWSPT